MALLNKFSTIWRNLTGSAITLSGTFGSTSQTSSRPFSFLRCLSAILPYVPVPVIREAFFSHAKPEHAPRGRRLSDRPGRRSIGHRTRVFRRNEVLKQYPAMHQANSTFRHHCRQLAE